MAYPKNAGANCRSGEIQIGYLRVGAKFRLNKDRGFSLTGTVMSHSTGQTTVKYDQPSQLEKVLGEEVTLPAGNVGISLRTGVVEISA